jgi:hypothetical protein
MARPGATDRRVLVAPVALAVVVAAAHTASTVAVRAPVVLPDELGYLDAGRFLALGGVRPITAYYPGFAALAAPAWWLTHNPITAWRAALWLNCGLAALTAVVVWSLVPRLCREPLGTPSRCLITAVACAYPAVVLYSDLAMAETAFAFGAAVVVLLAHRAASRGPVSWASLGVTAGLLVAVHPRGAAVAIAVFLVGLIALGASRASAERLLALVAGLTAGGAVTRLLIVAVRPARGTALGAYQADAVLSRAAAAGGLGSVALGVAGQVFYLSVVTAGLVPYGVVLGAGDLVAMARRRLPASPVAVARSVAALASLGVLAMSVLFLNGGDRADQLIYGRYNEGVLLAPMVVALGHLVGAPSGRQRRLRSAAWLGIGASSTGVGALALAFGRTPAQLHAQLNPGTVLALEPLLRRYGPGIDVPAIALAGAAGLLAMVAAVMVAPRVGALVIGVLFVAGSVDTLTGYLAPGSSARARQDVLATTISRASSQLGIPRSCVGYDAGIDFTYFNDRFYLPGWDVQPVDGAAGAPPCGPFVISSSPASFSRYPGAQLVSVENDLFQNLFVLAGPVQDRLRAAGWLLPDDLHGPLPAAGQVQRVSAASRLPQTIRPGASSKVKITATNAGRGSPWPDERGLKQDEFVVRVQALWFPRGHPVTSPGQGGQPVAVSMAELPRTLQPGEGARVTIALTARSVDGLRLPPGTYTVRIAVYQELVGTFPGRPLDFDITVLP